MRQLTSLDSQFLALETRRQTGHVASVAILDPSTTPRGALSVADIEALITERLPLLPPLRWRLMGWLREELALRAAAVPAPVAMPAAT